MIRSKQIRGSAKGQPCTLNIANCCNYDPATTVLCHIRDFGSGGTALKPSDSRAVFGCNNCHAAIDRRIDIGLSDADRYFYIARAIFRTIEALYEMGLIVFVGSK